MPGVKVLNEWLAAHEITGRKFALKIGYDPDEFVKLVQGKRKWVSVELAAKIEDATDGVVHMRLWIPEEAA